MESKLQRKIVTDLKKKGWIPLKVVISNTPGWPDISAFKDKKTIFIEVKDEGEEPEPLQELWHDRLRNQGFSVFVIDRWDEYLRIVTVL